MTTPSSNEPVPVATHSSAVVQFTHASGTRRRWPARAGPARSPRVGGPEDQVSTDPASSIASQVVVVGHDAPMSAPAPTGSGSGRHVVPPSLDTSTSPVPYSVLPPATQNVIDAHETA